MKIAVVRNQALYGVIFRTDRPSPERYGKRTVAAVVAALRDLGHEVVEVEGDMTMLERLSAFFGGNAQLASRDCLVVNMAYGIQGEARYTHVPAMLEMAGVPYTGAGPLGHAICLDKVIAKKLMAAAGVPTPPFVVASTPDMEATGLTFPLVVKPRHESTSNGLAVVGDDTELRAAVADVVGTYRQDALVEEYIDGREFCVALLGSEPVRALDPVELDFGSRDDRVNTRDDKFNRSVVEARKRCPADIPAELSLRLQQLATTTFNCCHALDYARVDIRIDRNGAPFVLEINSMASLGATGSYRCAAAAAGLDFTGLVASIVASASARYGLTSIPLAPPVGPRGEVPEINGAEPVTVR